MRVIAAPHEHDMITSNPQEILDKNQSQPAAVAPAEKPNEPTVPVAKINAT